jgi:hypothetical protein
MIARDRRSSQCNWCGEQQPAGVGPDQIIACRKCGRLATSSPLGDKTGRQVYEDALPEKIAAWRRAQEDKP